MTLIVHGDLDGDDTGLQYGVVVGGEHRVYGDQSWIAGGKAAEELGGRTVRRSVTVTYGEWEPVPPSLPPEPHVGAFVACGGDGNLLPFFRRWSEGWSVVSRDPQFSDVDSWAGVVAVARERAKRDPVLLAPVPEPVRLPWRFTEDTGFQLGVAVPERGYVLVNAMDTRTMTGQPVGLTPAAAREAAAALLSAADEAERTNA